MQILASTIFALAGLPYFGNAFPFSSLLQHIKRQMLSDFNDADILNYALTLEHLEATFYREAIAKFAASDFSTAGYDSTVYGNIRQVAADEADHVAFLTAGLTAAGATPVAECTYSFPYTDVPSFLAVASILEGVGVSAYLGAAAQIANKAYLTAAGSILTIEARHSSYIRALLDESPFAQPFDDPLTPNEVYTLAKGFIVSCPSTNPPLPLRAFPAISVTTTGPLASNQTVNIMTSQYVLAPADANAGLYAAFVGPTGPVFAPLAPSTDGMNYQVTIPPNVYGQSYLVFSNCNTTVSDDTTVAGPALLEIVTPPA